MYGKIASILFVTFCLVSFISAVGIIVKCCYNCGKKYMKSKSSIERTCYIGQDNVNASRNEIFVVKFTIEDKHFFGRNYGLPTYEEAVGY